MGQNFIVWSHILSFAEQLTSIVFRSFIFFFNTEVLRYYAKGHFCFLEEDPAGFYSTKPVTELEARDKWPSLRLGSQFAVCITLFDN